MEYQDINAAVIDGWVRDGWEWGRSLSPAVCDEVRKGNWDVVLTPNKPVPHAWFGVLPGKRILGLASGGGQQMPVFALLGAECTVLDYSPMQLASEKQVAAREGYAITIVRADMTKPLPFADGSFDLIFHPVSNCYVREVEPIWRECYRILKPGGILLAGMDNGINYLFAEDETKIVNTLPYDPLQNPEQMRQSEEMNDGIQFSHTLEEQIGGQLKAGFCLTDLYEDTNSEGFLKEHHVPTFLATRAVKP